ncbi:MAG TPA: hypothetical protein VHG72_06580 [Polyangia bacterium]|nr:hypothetical protein [Polyangia bacterium]
MRRSLVRAALLAALASAGCQTVDLGTPPADVNACEPSQQFFIDQIWPNFLGQTYTGGVHCYDSQCHDPGAGRQLSLTNPIEAGTVPLPTDWANNYASAASLMNCADPTSSLLLLVPEGGMSHGGGTLIMPNGPEATLIDMWVSAP